MTTKILMLLLGASCASACWAYSLWGNAQSDLLAPVVFTTIGVLAVIVYETVNVNK